MRPLSEYNAKRDFSQTREPKGRVVRGHAKSRRFVIQRHDATRLHFDLRLEMDGVYKSWAITKVPSLDPAVKRLAVEVEDHPIEYGTFEGMIPKGQYGGGTVQLWDKGTWKSQTPDPEDDLKHGHLKIVMDGERMQGKWALVRMRDDKVKPGRKVRHNWLLIKEIDDEAKRGKAGDVLAKDVTSVKTGRTLDEIAKKSTKVWNSNRSLKENLKANANLKANKPAKKTVKAKIAKKKDSQNQEAQIGKKAALPKFVEPQLCKIVATPPDSSDWTHEIKFDGYRVQMHVQNGRAKLLTRRGLDWTARFPEIAKEANALPDCLVDGEIVALDLQGVADFGALQQALSERKTSSLIFFAFDLLFFDGRDIRQENLLTRKGALNELLQSSARNARIRFVEDFSNAGAAVLNAACRMHLEGIISKRIEAPYRSGRSDSWVKSKCRGGQEVVIGGWWGDAKTLRSLLVGMHRDGKLVYAGRVGTGYKPKIVKEVLAKLQPLRRKSPPFAYPPPRTNGVHWVDPKLVADVEFAAITQAGLLRQASFKGLREDKKADSVVPESQPAAENAKDISMAKAKKSSAKAKVAGVVITHPDKELWPAAKPDPAFTKADLAKYYEAFSERILLHISGRPLSMVRAPDGIDGQRFFQRHANQQGLKVQSVKVKSEKEPYIAIKDKAGLASMAQAAVLEFHPWGCRAGDPETPERIIFDLDPAPDVSFDTVIDGAKELRARLEDIGLTPFIKTTGGKGLHIVAAIKGTPRNPVTWPDVKAFAKDVCQRMETDSPDKFTTTIAKKARNGKIFLDYLRNDKTSTAVAPWSPRARPHAPIATPITWSQLKKGLDPLAFTLRTAAQLLKKPDPWRDLHKSAVSFAAAREALNKKSR